LQRSQHSVSYYLNVEFAFRNAAGEVAEIHGRAERLLTAQDADRLRELLDIEGVAIEEEHREHELLALLQQLVPVLDGLSSMEATAHFFYSGGFKQMLVNGPALAAFGQ
jgi:hypothetical protein